MAEAAQHNIVTDDVKKAEGTILVDAKLVFMLPASAPGRMCLMSQSVATVLPPVRCRCHDERSTRKATSGKQFRRSGSFAGLSTFNFTTSLQTV